MIRKALFALAIFLLQSPFNQVSGSHYITMDASAMCVDTIDIDMVGPDVVKGDSVCIDIIFNRFVDINSMQFSINWDPSVLEFVRVTDVNLSGELADLGPSSFGTIGAPQGNIRFLWFDNQVNGETVPDGFLAGRLCFKAVGLPGEKTTIRITDTPIRFEVQDVNGNDLCLEDDGDDSLCILFPVDLCVIPFTCGTRTNNGSITIKAWGGTPPYMVDIPSIGVVGDVIPGEGDCQIYNGLNQGGYTVIVTDANGNDTTLMVTIGNADAIEIDTLQLESPKCADDENGIIDLDITGGSGPLTIKWSPINAFGQTRLTNLPQGQYTVTVSDTLGCMATETFDLATDVLTVDTSILKFVSCPGRRDGSIQVTPRGGTPFPGGEYDFTWSVNPAANGRDTSSINNRVMGKGFVVVEDMAGCRDTVFFDIPPRFDMEVAATIDSVLCHGDSSGMITLVATTNGMINSPYFFVLSNDQGPVVGGSVLNNRYNHPGLPAGCYFLQLVDASTCTFRDTFCVFEPSPVEVLVEDADTSSSCSPGNDGFLEAGAQGGVGNYSYSWDFMNTNGPRLNNIGPGNYTVTVTDGNRCTAERTFIVTGNNGPEITGFEVDGVSCLGDTSGQARVLYLEGDTTVIRFEWNNGKTGETNTGIGVGSHIVTITDENGCIDVDTVVIDTPTTSIKISSVIIDTPSCRGEMDGFIQVNVEGGNPPYNFLWNNFEVDSILTNIGAGQYIIEIGDRSNCPTIKDTFDLPDPPGVDIELLELGQVSCNDAVTCDAQVIVRASGGPNVNQGYVFQWSSGEIGFSSPDTARMLCLGDQYVVVANGDCADTLFFTIDAPEPIEVLFDSTIITRPSCFGSDDGMISLVTQGGTGSRTVFWDVGPMGNTLSNLTSGVYRFTIEDDNGCLKVDSVILNDPDSIEAFVIAGATRDIKCPGGSDGRITIGWNGGNGGNATFSWSPLNIQDSIATDLDAGRYFITVTDSKGCMDTLSHVIIEPPAIIADFPEGDSIACFGDQLPVTVIAATGGNGPDYTFTVNNGSRRMLGEEVPLFAGTYRISVFDNAGCSIDTTLTIEQPNQLVVEFGLDDCIELALGDSVRVCFNTNIPISEIESVVWTPTVTTTDSTGRCALLKPTSNIEYNVIVTDENGCTGEDNICIEVVNESRVFVPNIFNPGGDINTDFRVFTGNGVKAVSKMMIFDRWGELVYSQENLGPNDGWNGRFNNTGDELNPGVYVYLVEVIFKDDSKEIRRGDLTLIR